MKRTVWIGLVLLLVSVTLTGQEVFAIPPLLEGDMLTLSIQEGRLVLPFGESETLGYNGDYLGPTIRMSRGDLADIKVENTLGENTTVHWHGMHIPAEFDGGPRQVIKAGGTWNPRFTIDQEAATLWYHPHLMGKTAEHVYRGLAGLFLIEDEYSRSLDIPGEYGVNDIPVILQDRRIDRDGSFRFSPRMSDVMHGYRGNVLLVNGVYQPELNVSGGTYRFRILNASNSSIYRIRFADGRYFTVIAGDGGFLPEAVQTDELIVASGERFEILLDIDTEESVRFLTEIYGGDSFEVFSIISDGVLGKKYEHPVSLRPYTIRNEDSPDAIRGFTMETRGMRGFTINGKIMNLNRIDEIVSLNSTEHWIITNGGRGRMRLPHSIHVHDVQFKILDINGAPPHPLFSGPKDTILLFPGDRIRIALRFEDYTGIYMYHCHFLEHEDSGMMGQFEVIP